MCCNQEQKSCHNSENLKGKPEECTPEHIEKCHGNAKSHPCVETTGCEHPELLTGKPADCSPEQIRICHGDKAAHPCE